MNELFGTWNTAKAYKPLVTPFKTAAPINGGVWTNDPIGDSDGSGLCFVTGNRDENSDVDGGPTTMTSPAFDWSGKQISLCYDYFLNLTVVGGTPADSISVEVSSNGVAGPWRQVAVHATNGAFVWRGNVVTQSLTRAVKPPPQPLHSTMARQQTWRSIPRGGCGSCVMASGSMPWVSTLAA